MKFTWFFALIVAVAFLSMESLAQPPPRNRKPWDPQTAARRQQATNKLLNPEPLGD